MTCQQEKKDRDGGCIVLTNKEYIVLKYILKGLSVREINKLIDVKIKTTYTFCTTLKKKLGIMSTSKVYDYRSIIQNSIESGIIKTKNTSCRE
ncbi:LuxR C-terminal-related transcriptional regulator [Trabulsiella guamensis]|uniref:LuxR C-terminal-related transcriptional regulator n=1 Tax=Trabulsiella guamensis TaxID=158852 RepID=UPI000A030173